MNDHRSKEEEIPEILDSYNDKESATIVTCLRLGRQIGDCLQSSGISPGILNIWKLNFLFGGIIMLQSMFNSNSGSVCKCSLIWLAHKDLQGFLYNNCFYDLFLWNT